MIPLYVVLGFLLNHFQIVLGSPAQQFLKGNSEYARYYDVQVSNNTEI
jgi:hypothetical protein